MPALSGMHICELHGRRTPLGSVPNSNQDVELVPGMTTDNLSRIPSCESECHGRFRIQEQEGPIGMGIEPRDTSENSGNQGGMPG